MAQKCILIIEDSSKAAFGGGQKISLLVMKILSPAFTLILADCEQTTRFQQEAKPYVHRKVPIKCYGKIVGSKSAYAVGFKEIISFPFFAGYNFFVLTRQVKKLGPELKYIYATTSKALIYAYLLHLLYKIPYIFHAHSAGGQAGFWQKLVRPAYQKAQNIICVSNFVNNSLGTGNRITIYNPIPLQGAENKTRDINNRPKIVVASFSTLVPWKGIDYFMRSHSLLRTTKEVEYRIYGTGSQESELQKIEQPNVVLKGFINDTPAAMHHVDIVVIPSVAPESCPLTALEAMWMGVPMVLTNIGGQAEIVPDSIAGIQVPIKDSAALAAAIDKLIADPALYQNLSEGCKKQAARFGFDAFEGKIKGLFLPEIHGPA